MQQASLNFFKNMKLEVKYIDQIKKDFAKMQSIEDLLQILNEVKPLIYGDKSVPFKLNQLTWYSNSKLSGKRYNCFKIIKKSGKERIIHSPVNGLKAIQKTLSIVLQCVYEPHIAAMGFVRNRSIVTNANVHIGNYYIYNVDLKDFFPSIDQARVWKCLQLNPFNLIDDNSVNKDRENLSSKLKVILFETHPKSKNVLIVTFDNETQAIVSIRKSFIKEKDNVLPLFCDDDSYLLDTWHVKLINNVPWLIEKKPSEKPQIYKRSKIANVIAGLCCTELEVERITESGEWKKESRNVLPQGAPTSPVITNIVCQKLDYLLTGVAKRFGLKYTRYADDITFSSIHNVYQPGSEFLKELHRIIAEQKFHINESKTRLQKEGYRQEVTGLLVNEKVNVQKRYIKQLRLWLYYWERYGYERASEFFLQQYVSNKAYLKKGNHHDMENVISGKLDYLKMVKGVENSIYVKLRGRFNKLKFDKGASSRKKHLESILQTFIEEGFEKAMIKYEQF